MSRRKNKVSTPREDLLEAIRKIAYNSEIRDFKASAESAKISAERAVDAYKNGWKAAARAKAS